VNHAGINARKLGDSIIFLFFFLLLVFVCFFDFADLLGVPYFTSTGLSPDMGSSYDMNLT